MADDPRTRPDYPELARRIKTWARELGFQQLGVSDIDLSKAETRLLEWLRRGYHGDMSYMSRHGTRRSRPAELLPGTLRVISVRMDYLPQTQAEVQTAMGDANAAFISRYALARDYHKVLRRRLQRLAERLGRIAGGSGFRVFVDSAPVLEKPLAQKAGLGWIGKHTNLINRGAGSWFFLGELFTDLPLPVDTPAQDHCGRCRACMEICPTRAIVAPYQLDARLCISYLTIELKGSIPTRLRPLIGNRVYGCDDCQLVCPWNRFARTTAESDFLPRRGLDSASLTDLFAWTERNFLDRMEGSPIRRIGYAAWLRNLAVALGNAPPSSAAARALQKRRDHPSELVREHVRWAIDRQMAPREAFKAGAGGAGSDATRRSTP